MTEHSLKRQWDEQSYVVVRGLIDRDRVERLRPICEDILRQWRTRDPQTGQSDDGRGTVMRHLNHPAYFSRLPRAALVEILELIADTKVLDLAREVIGDEPVFRCTSLFMNPESNGSEGHWHRDSQFGAPDDEEEKKVLFNNRTEGIQLQIALVPSEDSEVVPGSHLRWDTPEEYRIRKSDGGAHVRSADMPGALRVKLQPGDAVAFNPMAHHRGRYHHDKPRRTVMLTYTGPKEPARDYFTNQPWFLEEGYLDGISPGARAFFERFIETFKEDWSGEALPKTEAAR